MKKALIVATIGGFICAFEKNDIKLLKGLGYEVYVACNTNGKEEELQQLDCKIVHLPIERNPLKKQNVTSYRYLKMLMEKEKFDLVHCHTPVGGILARMAARKYRRTGTKVIYTAHGFHFFKGAPLINWIIYYPIEWWFSKYTDVLVTINYEDYERAKTFHAKKVEYIPGVGVDIEKFKKEKVSSTKNRKEFGLEADDFVVVSVGELNKNKNHEVVIKAISKLNNPKVKYLICGQGSLESYLENLIEEQGLTEQVKLMGFRRDIVQLYNASNLFVFPSMREGLSVALMEAMACGLPVVCSKIRGNTDLIKQDAGGYLVHFKDVEMFSKSILKILEKPELAKKMAEYNRERIKEFSIEKSREKMEDIYLNI